MANAKMATQIGMWNPEYLSTKTLHGRALLQTFLMSFGQLCWVIMIVVAFAIVPLILIKPKIKQGGPILDAH
jgi:hypothetical protein